MLLVLLLFLIVLNLFWGLFVFLIVIDLFYVCFFACGFARPHARQETNSPPQAPLHRHHRLADQKRVQPDQEYRVKDEPQDHRDDVVTRAPRPWRLDQLRGLAVFQRDPVIDCIGQERPEQDDARKIAIGEQMGERPGLDRGQHGMLYREPPD